MSRTNRFIHSVAFSYGNQIVVMLVGLWLTPFLLKHLGQHDFGVWLVGLQSLSYLALLDLGVVGLLPREVAYASGLVNQGADPSTLRELIEENGGVVLWQTPILWIALLVVLWLVNRSNPELRGVMIPVLAVYGIQFPLRIFYASLEGLQDFAFIGTLQFFAWAAGVALNVSLVLTGWGLYSLAAGWAATQAITAGGSILRMYTRHPEFMPRRPRWLAWSDVLKHLKLGVWVSVSQVTQMLIGGSGIVLTASILGARAVVPYSCSLKLPQILHNQPSVILHAAQPGLTQLRATGTQEQIRAVMGSLTQAMLMLSGGIACVILAANQSFVERWVGPEQYLGFSLTLTAAIQIVVRHMNTTTIYTLFCFGKERYLSLVGLGDSIVTAILMYFLIGQFGSIGAPAASLITGLAISLPLNLIGLREATGVPIRVQLRPVLEWVTPFAAAAAGTAIVGYWAPAKSYLACGLLGLAAAAIYGLAEYRVIRYSPDGERFRLLIQSLWSKLRPATAAKV